MGLDLTLMPLHSKDRWVSFELIRIERDSDLFNAIFGIKPNPVPAESVQCFQASLGNGERGFGALTTDPYGSKLTYLTAGSLMTIQQHEGVQDDWKNRAVWRLLSEFPSDWPIVLYWH